MNIFDRLRKYIADKQLRKELSNISREKGVVNLVDARSIGVLYNIHNEESYNQILSFLKTLKADQRTVIAMGFYNDKKLPTYLNQSVYNSIIYLKDLNWYLKPVNQYVTNFYKEKFDICLNISLEDHYPLHYMMAHSDSKLRVGKYSVTYQDYYDLMIKPDEGTSQQDFIENMMHYLKLINQG